MLLTSRLNECPQVSVLRTRDADWGEASPHAPRPTTSSGTTSPAALLWRHQSDGIGTSYQAFRRIPGWPELQGALEALLRAWSHQLTGQLGLREAAFNIVSVSERNWRLGVMISPDEGLTLFVDDSVSPGQPSPQQADMISRGWQSFIPQLRVWDAVYEPGEAGAALAARLAVSELHHRGVRAPGDLRVADAVMGEHGHLDLPGLGIEGA
ncbi:hypothetical protein ACFVV7_26810 [Streptomyces globisporus]|uniref:hypothetical protein n=1 Tax=Streptomyces globisporus TaxID=1908 RepID=UPI0036D9CE2E